MPVLFESCGRNVHDLFSVQVLGLAFAVERIEIRVVICRAVFDMMSTFETTVTNILLS